MLEVRDNLVVFNILMKTLTTDRLTLGCDKIRPLANLWYQKGSFMIYMHDGNDRDRLDESLEELHRAVEPLITNKGTHVFILFNKQDLIPESERKDRLDQLRTRFEEATNAYRDKINIDILDLPGLSISSGHRLEEALIHIQSALLGDEKTKAMRQVKKSPAAPPIPTKAELIERIKLSSDAAESPEEFWVNFQEARLSLWDHYTHLRAGYFVIIEERSKGKNILEIGEEFVKHIDRLRTTNPDKFRNTTHRTMTIFWLIQLQAATLRYMDSVVDEKNKGYYPPFDEVLIHSPELMSSGLWQDYYSKEVLFTPNAKEHWRLPDLKPLPALPGMDWAEGESEKI